MVGNTLDAFRLKLNVLARDQGVYLSVETNLPFFSLCFAEYNLLTTTNLTLPTNMLVVISIFARLSPVKETLVSSAYKVISDVSGI